MPLLLEDSGFLSEKEEEQYPPRYGMPPMAATPSLVTVEMVKAATSLSPATDSTPSSNPRTSDSGRGGSMKDNPIVAVVIILALLLVGLAFLSGILKF